MMPSQNAMYMCKHLHHCLIYTNTVPCIQKLQCVSELMANPKILQREPYYCCGFGSAIIRLKLWENQVEAGGSAAIQKESQR